VVNLYDRVQAITGLLLNSSELQKVVGEHVVVGIGALEQALNDVPDAPISLDFYHLDKIEKPEPLVNFFMESASPHVPFVTIHLEFNSNPEWDSSREGLMLRDSRVAERMKPVFYQQASLLNGIGRLDSEGRRSGPSPLFGLLRVAPANEDRISIAAVTLIDSYVSAVLNDPYTLGH
jgi:hypothetical protein